MKKLVLSLLLGFTLSSSAQNLYFPPTSGSSWDTLSATSLGWCANYLDTLDDYLLNENSRAFILLKDGKIVHEKYFNGFHVDSNHAWNSAGKTLTAFLVGMAQQENHLNINDKTSDYLGNGWTIAPQAKEDLITVKRQLTMTSGLDDSIGFCTDDTCLIYKADAGTRWAYQNGPYTLLQQVIQNAVGVSANTYLVQKLYSSIGIQGGFLPILYNRVMFSKPRSMARFGLLMLNKGNWNGNQIMTDTNYLNAMITPSQNLNNAYGYLWWLNGQSSFMLPQSQNVFPGKLFPDAPDDVYAGLGKDDQLLVICPSKNLVFIRMGASGNGGFVGTSMTNEIWQILNKLMCTPNRVEEVSAENQIEVYPNPVSDLLQIKSTEKIISAKLYNTLGEELVILDKDRLDMSSFPIGTYFIGIQTKSGTQIEKVLKN